MLHRFFFQFSCLSPRLITSHGYINHSSLILKSQLRWGNDGLQTIFAKRLNVTNTTGVRTRPADFSFRVANNYKTRVNFRPLHNYKRTHCFVSIRINSVCFAPIYIYNKLMFFYVEDINASIYQC